MGLRRIATLTAVGTLALTGVFATSAQGSYHFNQIRQIHPSTNPLGGDWVELQMYATGQNLVTGKVIRTFNPDGVLESQYVIGDGPGPHPGSGNGQNQRTILISSLFEPFAGVLADFVAPVDDLQMTGQDGAVCFTENDPPSYTPIDCVSYGNFTGTIPSAGTPAVQTAFGSTLERSITRGCATAIDPADDTNDSSADFALSTNAPRNNATAPTETLCAAQATPPATPVTPNTPGPAKPKCKKKKKSKSATTAAKCKKKKK